MQIFLTAPSAVLATRPNSTTSANRKRGPNRRARVGDAEWAELSLVQRQPERPSARDLAASHLHGIFAMTRDTVTQRRRTRAKLREAAAMSERSPARRRRSRSRAAARLHFRRQAVLGFAGDSIASGLLGERRRNRRPQLQIPPAARNLGRVDRGAERDRRRDARRQTTPNLRATTEPLENDLAVRSVNAAPTAAADRAALIDRLAPRAAGGLLLQDFPLAALGGLRRPDPRHGRPRPHRSGQSPAGRQSADQRALRSARRRRGSGGSGRGGAPRARAGRVVFSSTTMPRSAASSSIAAARSRAATGATGRRASCAPSKPPAGG